MIGAISPGYGKQSGTGIVDGESESSWRYSNILRKVAQQLYRPRNFAMTGTKYGRDIGAPGETPVRHFKRHLAEESGPPSQHRRHLPQARFGVADNCERRFGPRCPRFRGV
jgi:hypothetical protein